MTFLRGLTSACVLSLAGALTAATPAAALPDGRAWEQVSPVAKQGAGAGVANQGTETNPDPRPAPALGGESGNTALYSANGQGLGGATRGFTVFNFARRTSAGWVTERGLVNGPPNGQDISAIQHQTRNVFLSPELDRALFSSAGSFGDGAPDTLTSGSVWLTDSAGDQTWISRPQVADPSPLPGEIDALDRIFTAGAARDMSAVYFSFKGRLVPEDTQRQQGEDDWGVYRYANGKLELASVLPGEVPVNAQPGDSGAFTGDNTGPPANVSEDGSRIVFVTPAPANFNQTNLPRQLYMRIDGERTVPITRSARTGDNGAMAPSGAANLEDDSQLQNLYSRTTANGEHVFFVSRDALTDAAPDNGQRKVYRFDLAAESETPQLTYLPQVPSQLRILAVSDDGQRLLVRDTSDFDDQPLLAVDGDDVTSLGLARATATGSAQTVEGPARLSDDGQVAAFDAGRPLTGATTHTLGTNQVYRYEFGDAQAQCVSCPATGAASNSYLHRGGVLGIDTFTFARPRGLTDDGSTVVFDSDGALGLTDVNGKPDVYRWRNGGVEPVTPGTSSRSSYYVDSSASGNDIFVTTADALVPTDGDRAYDVYDARVGGGFPVPAPATPCTGEACQGAPAGPVAPPASGSSGVGAAPPRATRLSVARLSSRGRRGRVRVRVFAPGTVTLTGGRAVRAVKRSVRGPSRFEITFRLSARTARTLERRKSVRVGVRVRFAPRQGAPASKTIVVTVKR